MSATWWRGVQLDQRSADMMTEVDRLLPHIPIYPSQGSWSGADASAGTHSGGGAIDVTGLDAAQCDELVATMRRVGWAAWHRTPEQSDWVRHVHGIAVQPGGEWDRGCLSGAAHEQVVDYYDGRNGLASGAPDDGPRQHVGTTWETYEPASDPQTFRRPTMILVQAPDGRIALVGLSGPAWVHNSDSLAEVRKALADPGYIAKVDAKTWDRLESYASAGGVP